jgi:transposase
MDLTDEQWSVIQPLIPDSPRRKDGKGRPWRDSREVMNGILWILRTGACWYDMPNRYPPYPTCHRRFQQWVRSGVFQQVLEALANDLKDRGGLDLSECHIDGMFIVAKKGADVWERPSAGKVRSSWQWQTVLMAFLSPYTLRLLLRRMKSPLLKRLSPSVLSLMKNQRV